MLPIFDELVYAEKLLSNGFIKLMSYNDLLILSKFYFFKTLDEEQVRKKLNAFCYKYNPEYNEVIFGNTIDKAIRNGKKGNLWIPKNVVITKDEIQRIKQINNYRYEKILFALLVCAKFQKQKSNNDGKKNIAGMASRYFANQTMGSVLSLAKVHANRKEQAIIRADIYKLRYTLSLRKNKLGGFEILYADTNYNADNIFAEITSRDDIIDFYPPYLICLGCGKEIDKVGNNKKYCQQCWQKTKNERNKRHMQKTRQQV